MILLILLLVRGDSRAPAWIRRKRFADSGSTGINIRSGTYLHIQSTGWSSPNP